MLHYSSAGSCASNGSNGMLVSRPSRPNRQGQQQHGQGGRRTQTIISTNLKVSTSSSSLHHHHHHHHTPSHTFPFRRTFCSIDKGRQSQSRGWKRGYDHQIFLLFVLHNVFVASTAVLAPSAVVGAGTGGAGGAGATTAGTAGAAFFAVDAVGWNNRRLSFAGILRKESALTEVWR